MCVHTYKYVWYVSGNKFFFTIRLLKCQTTINHTIDHKLYFEKEKH